MQNMEQNNKNDFIIEKIKERPINRKKLVRRSIMTAALAVMFGLIACFTFLVLEPVISNWLYPNEEPNIVIFPEEQEEMDPEEMLSDNISAEEATPAPTIAPMPVFPNESIPDEQTQEVLNALTLSVDHYSQLYSSLGNFVKELNRYMVTVTAIRSQTDWLQNVTESQTQTTGVVIGNNGKELLILTNYSSLEDADSLQVSFYGSTVVEAQLKQQHANTDIAILSINPGVLGNKINDIAIASFGSSNTKSLLCTPVIALGSPLGEIGSVGYGMIASENGRVIMTDGNYKLLVTDIYGSLSASGFLFNMKGQIIGMITPQRNSSDIQNLVRAYGISDLKKLISNLSEGADIGYMGITATDVSEEANTIYEVPKGVYVTDVDMNSPAMKAGILPGDIIVGIGNTVVSTFSNYFNTFIDLENGQVVKLTIMRQFQDEYKEMEFDILLEAAD